MTKRLFALLFAALLAFALASCGKTEPKNDLPDTPSFPDTSSENREEVSSENSDERKTEFQAEAVRVAYVSEKEMNKLYARAINGRDADTAALEPMPVFMLTSLEELETFKNEYSELLGLKSGYDEIKSFNEAVEKYDSAFFEKNTLSVVYFTSGSGSFRYAVSDVDITDNTLTVHIKRTNNPEAYTCDMAGWCVCVALAKSDTAGCESFTADIK